MLRSVYVFVLFPSQQPCPCLEPDPVFPFMFIAMRPYIIPQTGQIHDSVMRFSYHDDEGAAGGGGCGGDFRDTLSSVCSTMGRRSASLFASRRATVISSGLRPFMSSACGGGGQGRKFGSV